GRTLTPPALPPPVEPSRRPPHGRTLTTPALRGDTTEPSRARAPASLPPHALARRTSLRTPTRGHQPGDPIRRTPARPDSPAGSPPEKRRHTGQAPAWRYSRAARPHLSRGASPHCPAHPRAAHLSTPARPLHHLRAAHLV